MYKTRTQMRNKKMLLLCATALFFLALLWLMLLQNLSARTTYVITDGRRVTVHTTTATDPEAVLGEAGLELGEDDTYTTQTEAGTAQINILRGKQVRINYYGETLEVTSGGETVGELLARLNLTWNEEDAISVPLNTGTYDGMALTIARVVRENQVYTTSLAHETIHCSDDALPEGVRKVVTEGVDGQLLCEATVTYLNGVEASRDILNRQVTSQPVSEIIAVGTGAPKETPEETPRAVVGAGTITLPGGEVVTFTEKVTCLATAYHCEGYVGTTATGTRARVGAIAVDPEVFPYGTRFYIETKDGAYVYGIATAEDCGDKRFIYDTRLDLYFNTEKECIQFGARSCDVYILG